MHLKINTTSCITASSPALIRPIPKWLQHKNPFLIVVATLLQHSAYISKYGPFPASPYHLQTIDPICIVSPCLDETHTKMAAVFEPKLVWKANPARINHPMLFALHAFQHVIVCHVRFILQTPPAYRSLTGSAASTPK